MPIIIKDTLNNFTEIVGGLPLSKTILNNPIYTAAILALLCMLLTFIIFRDEEIDDKTLLILRLTIYMFLGSMGILYLYNNKVLKEFNMISTDSTADRIFSSVKSGAGANNAIDDDMVVVSVNISDDFGSDDVNSGITNEISANEFNGGFNQSNGGFTNESFNQTNEINGGAKTLKENTKSNGKAIYKLNQQKKLVEKKPIKLTEKVPVEKISIDEKHPFASINTQIGKSTTFENNDNQPPMSEKKEPNAEINNIIHGSFSNYITKL